MSVTNDDSIVLTRQVLLELSFPEISSVTASSSGRLFDQTVTFATLLMETFTLKCSNAEDIRDVVDFFLKGLKDRSQYAVATGAYKPLGGGAGLRRGDLVRLAYDQTGASLLKTGWCVGTNERTKVETDWPLESLHLVPTLSRPTEEVLELLSKEASELKPRSHATPTAKPGKDSAGAHHTLEQFAEENFRKAQQVGVGGTTRQKTLIHSAGETSNSTNFSMSGLVRPREAGGGALVSWQGASKAASSQVIFFSLSWQGASSQVFIVFGIISSWQRASLPFSFNGNTIITSKGTTVIIPISLPSLSFSSS